jgi:putative ABC transport system permease protein
MRPPFGLLMAWREGRRSLLQFPLLLVSIAVGVGALVAIDSFSANLRESVHAEARGLLGADLALRCGTPFSSAAEEDLANLARDGQGAVSRVTRFVSMAYAPRTSGTHLVQVTAIEGGYPYYGTLETDPPGAFAKVASERAVLVDPALLLSLNVHVGDEVALSSARFVIGGTVVTFPGDVGFRSTFGPRVFVALRHVSETGLLGFGSRGQYEAYVKLPNGVDENALAKRYRRPLARERVTLRTVQENEENLSRSLVNVGRFLSLVALLAVLLGGLGVGSAVHVFIKRRTETIAILRCLGAPARTVLTAYVLHSVGLALLGSVLGAGAGVALQALLPRLFADLLPVAVSPRPSPHAVVAGVGVGLLIATLFALLPLLSIRRISPLAVLRRSFDEERKGRRLDPARILVGLLLAAAVVFASVAEAGNRRAGVGFALGVAAAIGLLAAAALALTSALRRALRGRWPYLLRQGLSNLYRPANQTLMVVLVLGFGAFLLDTLFLVERNLLRDLRVERAADRPNLALFDIQRDELDPVTARLREAGLRVEPPVPIVPMRILSVKGAPVAATLETLESGPRGGRGGVLRREYRSTYRDTLTPTERTVSGRFWSKGAGKGASPVPISVEADLAREIGVRVGDAIVWDVQGVKVETRVAHLRGLTWARFEPNFFVVFPEGPLDAAPQTYVTLTRVEEKQARASLERSIVQGFPNVSLIDLSEVQGMIDKVVARASAILEFMAVLCLLTGSFVLVGAVLTSRYQRLREAVLLRTLGATRRQILAIAFVEYATLAALSCLAAALLAIPAGFGVVHYFLESTFVLPAAPLTLLALGVLLLTTLAGLLSSLAFLGAPPLRVLRAE